MAKEIFEVIRKKGVSQEDLGLLIALSACIIGGGLRLYTAYFAGFPINDGGLFYVMTRAIQLNGYALPKYVYFNSLEIPFAYPPLGFYIAGLVNDVLGMPLIEVFRWLPAVILTGSIFIFYKVAKIFLRTNLEAGIATLLFALLPRSMTWLIMGGGITRSFGQLFLMLSVYNYYHLFSTGERKYLWLSIFSSSLVCLTHPEATIHTIGIAVLVWVFYGRSQKGIRNAFLVAAGTILLTTIWWIPVILSFGVAPFISASQTSLHNYLFIVYFLTIPFSDEPHQTIIIVLSLIGIAVALAKKQLFLPLFFTIPFIVEPRNAANVSVIPMAVLASMAISQLILPGLKDLESKVQNLDHHTNNLSPSGTILLAYFSLSIFIGMLYFSAELANKRVSNETLDAFNWIVRNTPAESRFIVLTGSQDLFGDWTQEWFFALTNRISITTIQGREWIDGEAFYQRTAQYQELQKCFPTPGALACINKFSRGINSPYDYLFIAKKINSTNRGSQGEGLVLELSKNEDFTLIYETAGIVIFEHQPCASKCESLPDNLVIIE